MRNRLDTVMFFCAGRGTRMKALTKDQPKPMVPVAGRPLVDHALDQLIGFDRQFANVHYHPEKLQSHLKKAGLETVFEEHLLETGGGLKALLPQIDRDAVLTMNTDSIWRGPIAGQWLSDHWKPEIMDALLLTVPQKHAHAHKGTGDFLSDSKGRLSRGSGDVFTGLQIVKTRFVEEVSEQAFSMNEVWKTLLERETLFGVNYPGDWCDVGYPEAISVAKTLLET